MGYDETAALIKRYPLADYMNAYPAHKSGLWAKELGKEIGVRINLGSLKAKYANVVWKEKT